MQWPNNRIKVVLIVLLLLGTLVVLVNKAKAADFAGLNFDRVSVTKIDEGAGTVGQSVLMEDTSNSQALAVNTYYDTHEVLYVYYKIVKTPCNNETVVTNAKDPADSIVTMPGACDSQSVKVYGFKSTDGVNWTDGTSR